VRLWALSDLHLELTRGWHLPPVDARPQFDVLVVAGDLVPRMERGVKWLLERFTEKPVIYIPGNHEGYGADIDRTVEKAKLAAEGTNVQVLQDETVTIDGTTFAGSTLWADFDLFGDQRRAMRVAGDRMNDHKKIRTNKYAERFRPQHALARHHASRAFLGERVAQAAERPAGDRDAPRALSRPAARAQGTGRTTLRRAGADGSIPKRSDPVDAPRSGRGRSRRPATG
jgi:Calcineurin-like phosphoesterase